MSRRGKMSRGHSKKLFRRTAGGAHMHRKNALAMGSAAMRGGTRL